MSHKLAQFREDGEYLLLEDSNKRFLEDLDRRWRLTFQEIRSLIRMARDLETWDEGSLASLWGEEEPASPGNRQEKERLFRRARERWTALKECPKSYEDFQPERIKRPSPGFQAVRDDRTILGECPVASPKTRCCNLKTLDAVINCGFDCSYCSIQSFYRDNRILFHRELKEKLARLDLDPDRIWHIGTGQSSDSLMWGNREGLLEDLTAFARRNPNVILELKTKSDNIGELLDLDPPPNLLATWSLNTDRIIRAEERLTAPLAKRLEAARKAADRGVAVGFHLHPMVWYQGWEEEYAALIRLLTDTFRPEEVVTLSLGTLTFIKPVLKELRKRPIKSKILQMPLEEAAGKWSYPMELKKELFRRAYESFAPWHGRVFFYLCMEDPSLWEETFRREYPDNRAFEEDMLEEYKRKMDRIAARRPRQERSTT